MKKMTLRERKSIVEAYKRKLEKKYNIKIDEIIKDIDVRNLDLFYNELIKIEISEKKRLRKEFLIKEGLRQERLRKQLLQEKKERSQQTFLEKISLERAQYQREILGRKLLDRGGIETKTVIQEFFRGEGNTSILKEEEKTIICPYCHRFSVKLYQNSSKWYCDYCELFIFFNEILNTNSIFEKSEKYKVYKLFGIDALAKLLGQSKEEVQNFVADYFENCCSSKGNKCLYYGHFEDVKWDKQIQCIELSLERKRGIYTDFYQKVKDFSNTVEMVFPFLNHEKQIEINNEYSFFKETVEQILSHFDDYIIALANEDLSKDQKVVVSESNEHLVASSDFDDGIEGFIWNDARKGEMVSILPISIKFCNELADLFREFAENVNKMPMLPANLPLLEYKALRIITSEKEIYQNQLWKILDVDSRKCSRIVKSLLDKNLIRRQQAASNGARTYLLKSRANI